MTLPRSRLLSPRRFALALGALGLATTLAVSGLVGDGVQMTEAAWTDTEVAQTSITAEWSQDSWTRATVNAFTNHGSYDPVRNPEDYTHARFDDRPSINGSREWDGHHGQDYRTGRNFGIRSLGSRTDVDMNFCSQAGLLPEPVGDHTDCNGGPEYTPNYAQARTKAFGSSGGFAHPGNNRGLSFSDDIVAIEAQNVQTMAECAPDGESIAMAPVADSSWGGASGDLFGTDEPYGSGQGIGAIFSNQLGVGNQDNNRYSYIQIPEANTRITRWMRPNRISGTWTHQSGDVYFRVTITSRQYTTYGYALSDLYLTIDQYTTDNGNPYTGSFTMILSRSECGIETPSFEHSYLEQVFETPDYPDYPDNPAGEPVVVTAAPLPLQDGTLAYPGDPDYPAEAGFGGFALDAMTLQGIAGEDPVAAELPPMTTVTSPLETTTASETTTSAPPNPDDRDDSSSVTNSPTTSRSAATTRNSPAPPPNPQPSTPTSTAAPDVVIPRDPGTLGAAARTEDVATVTVQEEELDVVVVGNTVPTDARAGARALRTWLGGGTPNTTWAMFTATDPDEDGWRWAAISQTSGTVVYIR